MGQSKREKKKSISGEKRKSVNSSWRNCGALGMGCGRGGDMGVGLCPKRRSENWDVFSESWGEMSQLPN